MSTHLLIVEDDDRLRGSLRLALENEAYVVSEATRAETALDHINTRGAPDVLIVDLVLGGMDGFTLIRMVRREHDTPIIVVSGHQDTHDIVAALEAGADDFVPKPFEIHELAARIRAVRRRTSYVPDRPLTALILDAAQEHRLVLYPQRGTLELNGQELYVTVTEFRLLSELALNAGLVLSRQQLIDRVWDRGLGTCDERIVGVHLRRLRAKIERDPSQPRMIVTVRGLGYRIDLPG